MCYLNNIIQITRRYLNTVRGQLGFGLDQSEVMKSVTTNHKSDVSPGLGWRRRQVSPGLGWHHHCQFWPLDGATTVDNFGH